MALAAGFPAVVLAMILLWTGQLSPRVQWTLTVLIGATWLGFALALREQVIRPLQTISNMLGALREGDYSIRARQYRTDDALGLAMLEVNTLGETLHRQRLDALEATALLSKVMEEIDVAAFTFDGNTKLRLVNRGGERLLGKPPSPTRTNPTSSDSSTAPRIQASGGRIAGRTRSRSRKPTLAIPSNALSSFSFAKGISSTSATTAS